MRARVLLVWLMLLSACVMPRGTEGPDDSPSAGWFTWDDYGYFASLLPDSHLLMPVRGVRVKQVANTFGASRSGGRSHEGQDIFAPKGTPIYSATEGLVTRMGYGELGGLYVYVLGPGGRWYYYAHLDAYAPTLKEGDRVTPQSLLGYVGNTGNARTTPAHLHFGVYGSGWSADERVINPLPLLVDRNWKTLQAANAGPSE